MTDLQIYLTLGIFGAVILAIAFDIVDMAVAALLGVSLMMLFGILTGKEILDAMTTGGGPLSLLFGGMVVARVLSKTGIFERIGDRFLQATGQRQTLFAFAHVTDRAGLRGPAKCDNRNLACAGNHRRSAGP
jgi:Na+/H+ antiporter NhaD/arsenite permease-like protein